MSRFGSVFLFCFPWAGTKKVPTELVVLLWLVRASHGECLQTIMFDMFVQTSKKTSHAPTIGKHLVSSRLEGGPCNPEETMFPRAICLHNAVLRLVHGVASVAGFGAELARREL